MSERSHPELPPPVVTVKSFTNTPQYSYVYDSNVSLNKIYIMSLFFHIYIFREKQTDRQRHREGHRDRDTERETEIQREYIL